MNNRTLISVLKNIFVFIIILTAGLFTTAQTPAGVSYYSDPALSPDASEIAFVSGGDIWTVPASGGEARLLVSHPDYESRPLYSPDGKSLAFVSARTGNGDIYVLNFQSGQVKRLTYDDASDALSAWSADSRYLYFTSTGKDIAGMGDIFRVSVNGGTPMPVSNNRYVSEFWGTPSPDGKMLAMAAHGVGASQWWRNGRSHLDESEIWVKTEGKKDQYQRITPSGARNYWPMWSDDGKQLFYVSDKTGAQNLYVQTLTGAAKQLTEFKSGRLLWPSIAKNGKAIVFERDFKVWFYDITSGKTRTVDITRRGAPAGPVIEHVKLNNKFREFSLSPDGKKVAFTARGEVFIASAKDGGDAVRVTTTSGLESQIAWNKSSNNIIYVSDRDGASHIYQYNFITNKETRLTDAAVNDAAPKYSPDGKSISFIRDAVELRTIDTAGKKETVITKGYIGSNVFPSQSAYAWSPDSKWIAYTNYTDKSFQNLYIAPATGGAGKAVSFLANGNSDNPTWSKDSKYILFTTGQRTENGAVARVDLIPQRPRFKEEQFQEMFIEQTPTTPSNTKPATAKTATAPDTLFKGKEKSKSQTDAIIFDGIRQRLNLLPLGVDVNEQVISPDGNTLLLVASVAGQQNLFTYSLDELSKEPAVLKQLTSTASPKNFPQFTADSKTIFYMEPDKIQSIDIETQKIKPLAITAELDIDFNQEKLEVFKQIWNLQNNGFYDPKFNGADWNKIKQTYQPLAAGANTPDELRRLMAMMVGELNASHSGVSGAAGQFNVGKLGLRFSTDEYETNGKLKIVEVIKLGPADIAGGIEPGDLLVAVDGKEITGTVNLDQLLENKINRMVSLTIGSDASTKKVSVRPVNLATEKGLLYKQWVQEQRDYVYKVSKGRLGYVHMFDMSEESLNQFYLNIDAENHAREGVVVDIRNNNGGFVNGYALDVLSRKNFMTLTVRGLPASPSRIALGQRALDAPSILVTNQHSLSDAEDFSEGYRTLNLGKIVGEPTAGWIIYTSNMTLFDGTSVRIPFVKVTDHEGKNMELNPRRVDIEVSNPLGQGDNDEQLNTAVKELLKQIDENKRGR